MSPKKVCLKTGLSVLIKFAYVAFQVTGQHGCQVWEVKIHYSLFRSGQLATTLASLMGRYMLFCGPAVLRYRCLSATYGKVNGMYIKRVRMSLLKAVVGGAKQLGCSF